MKTKTNEELFKQLIKELEMFELALLRERIVTIMDITEQWANNESENPTDSSPFIDPRTYLDLAVKVKSIIGFND